MPSLRAFGLDVGFLPAAANDAEQHHGPDQLRQGRSDAQIREYMVQRYGDFVLYRPPLKATTLLLWFGPFVLVIAGVAALGLVLARRAPAPAGLSQDESRRAAALLGEGDRT